MRGQGHSPKQGRGRGVLVANTRSRFHADVRRPARPGPAGGSSFRRKLPPGLQMGRRRRAKPNSKGEGGEGARGRIATSASYSYSPEKKREGSALDRSRHPALIYINISLQSQPHRRASVFSDSWPKASVRAGHPPHAHAHAQAPVPHMATKVAFRPLAKAPETPPLALAPASERPYAWYRQVGCRWRWRFMPPAAGRGRRL